MKQVLKKKIKTIANKYVNALRLAVGGINNEGDLRTYLKNTGGIRVLNGPFKGMLYVEKSYGSSWAPKVLGSYEQELHSIINSLQLESYKCIIDIGCAEGYYLAGMAHMAREKGISIEIHGYDLNNQAVQTANKLCSMNNLEAKAHCKRYELDEAKDDNILFIIDIEGDEFELLGRETIWRLKSCSFLVEVHEPKGSRDMLNQLCDAFSCSHNTKVINAVPRYSGDVLSLNLPGSKLNQLELINEGRIYGNTWLFASSKASFMPSI